MSTAALPDPVPLGVSGYVTIPLARYRALVGARPVVLLNDNQRQDYVSNRLQVALDRPLTSPGSQGFARQVLAQFPDIDVMYHFAAKALETLRDGQSHNRTAISSIEPRVAVLFVAWNGSHRQLQAQRYGNYLGPLVMTAKRLVERGIHLVGILEIDAYLRDTPDPQEPGRSLDDVFQVDVEFSYLPGWAVGSPAPRTTTLSDRIMLNPDLCDDEERHDLDRLMANTN